MTILHRTRIRAPTAFAMALAAGLTSFPAPAADTVSFSEDIFPIIQIRCLECHQPDAEGYEKSGLDLRTYEGLMKGTKFGPMVIPHDPFRSNLMVMMDGRAADEIRMPHGKRKISSCDRDLFRLWIKQGAMDN